MPRIVGGLFVVFVSGAIAFSLNHQRFSMVHQSVDDGGCQHVVDVEDFAPFTKNAIRGDHDRAALITACDHLEHQIGAALVDRQVAQLIQQKQGWAGILLEPLFNVPLICAVVSTLIMSITRVQRTEIPFSQAV